MAATKTAYLALVLTLLGLAGLVGCGGREEVATANLEASFASAEVGLKTSLNKAVTALKAGEHAKALSELEMLAGNPKLTTEQRAALKDVMTQIKRIVADTAKEAVESVGKSLDNVKGSAPK